MSKDINPEIAKEFVKSVLEEEVSTQPAELERVNLENETIGAFFSETPNIHKQTTDSITDYGWHISGIVGDTVYFRRIDD